MNRLILLALIIFCSLIGASTFASTAITREEALKTVVQIFVVNQKTEKIHSSGSGVIINPHKRQAVTALHVVNPAISNNSLFDLHVCTSQDSSEGSKCYFAASVQSYNKEYDVAIIEIDRAFDKNGKKHPLSDFKKNSVTEALSGIFLTPNANQAQPRIGENIWLVGYPSSGGKTLTLSAGVVSGTESGKVGKENKIVRIKTDASANRGNSGGPVFDNQNRFLGITISVITDISPITFITSWAVIKDLLYNGVMARPGVLCPDYTNMERRHGICECKSTLKWNEEKYMCKNPQEKEHSPNTQGTLDSVALEEENKILDEEILEIEPQVLSPKESKKEEIKKKKDDFSDTEKKIGRKKIKSGVLDAILECREVKKFGKEAFRNCFRMTFSDFVRTRQKILRKAKRLCKKDVYPSTHSVEIGQCLQKKLQKN